MHQQQSLPTDKALEYYSLNQIPPPLHRVPPEKLPPLPAEPKQVIKRLPIAPTDESALRPKPPARPVDNFCFDYDAFQEVLDFLNAPPNADFMNSAYPHPDVVVGPKTDPFVPYPDVVDRPSRRKKFTETRLREITTRRSIDKQPIDESDDVFSDPKDSRSPQSDCPTHTIDPIKSIIDTVRSDLLRAPPESVSDDSLKDTEEPVSATNGIVDALQSGRPAGDPNRSPLLRNANIDDDSSSATRMAIFKTTKSRSTQRQCSDSSRSSRCANNATPVPLASYSIPPSVRQPTLSRQSSTTSSTSHRITEQPIGSGYESRDRGRGRDVYRENRHHRGGGASGGGSDRDLEASFRDRDQRHDPMSFNRRMSNADRTPEDFIGKLIDKSMFELVY